MRVNNLFYCHSVANFVKIISQLSIRDGLNIQKGFLLASIIAKNIYELYHFVHVLSMQRERNGILSAIVDNKQVRIEII